MAKTKMYVEVTCRVCGKTHKIEVDPVGFKKFEEGTMPIQDALPGLTNGQREMLLSQICEECSVKELCKNGQIACKKL